MNQLFTAYHELQPYGALKPSTYDSAVYRAANRLMAASRHSDVIAIIAFCAVGVTLTLAATAWLPDFAAAVAQIGTMS